MTRSRELWWACDRDRDHEYMVPDMVPAELVPTYSPSTSQPWR